MSKSSSEPSRKSTFGQTGRFVLVGGANTLIDVLLLILLRSLGVPLWIANAASTSAGLAFSYFANRSFTFRSTKRSTSQIFWFVLVTLFGLWVLQPLAMTLVISLASTRLEEPILTLVAKGVATVVSMTWNYAMYKKVIFRHSQD